MHALAPYALSTAIVTGFSISVVAAPVTVTDPAPNSVAEGNSTGTFINPSPTCPPATCTGVGTSSFNWGAGRPTSSSLSFTPTSFNPAPGEVFSLGTLNYSNGPIASGSGVNNVSLNVVINFMNVPEKSTSLLTNLSLNNTPNTDDPAASADYVYFSSGEFTASFHVLEDASVSANLFAKIIAPKVVPGNKSLDLLLPIEGIFYNIELLGFGNVVNGSFVDGGDPSINIPEPSSVSMLIAGFIGLLCFGHHHPRKNYFQSKLSENKRAS